MSSIDHDKKMLHDSLSLIAHEDTFKLLLDLGAELYHRRELCRGAFEAKMEYSELALAQLKYQNDRIMKLLGL